MSSGRVFITEGAGARWSSLGRGDHQNRAPGERTVSLVGGRARSTKAFRGESQGVSSRVTSLAILSGWAGNPKPSGLTGACLHPSKAARATKLERRESCSNGFAPRAGGTAKRQLGRARSIAHRPARGRASREDGHVSSGNCNGSTGARGTCRLLKSKRGIFLVPGVSTKGEALNARQGPARRLVPSRRVAARWRAEWDSKRTHERRSNEGGRGRFSSQRVSSRAARLRSLGSRLRTERRAKGRTS
jgi:hypothetical protein